MAGASPVQTQEDLVPPAPAAIGYRLAGVLLAAPVAVAVHVVLVGPFGLSLLIPESPGSSTLAELDLLTTAMVTLVVSLAGWITVTVLERGLGGERGRRIWTILAFAVFVLSIPPIAMLDSSVGDQWGLFALHVAVAVVLIPTLANGTPATHPVAGGWVEANAASAQEDTHASPATATAHDQAEHAHGIAAPQAAEAETTTA